MSYRQRSGDHPVTDVQSPVVEPVEASRRTVLRGALLAGVAGPLLAACRGSSDSSADSTGTRPATSGKSPNQGGDPSGGGGNAQAIASVADVPEGGGVILDDRGIVITQPTAGQFRGFTNICTHAGCPLHDVTNGTINCTCHGSMFSIDDGSVVGGPAPTPLPEKAIAVDGQDISLA